MVAIVYEKTESFAKQLKLLIQYNPNNGEMLWLPRTPDMFYKEDTGQCTRWNKIFSGKPALSCSDAKGYLSGSIGKKTLLAHHAAWAIHYGRFPSNTIDHINGIKSDNRICNLRDVSVTENIRNRPVMRHNTSGVSGVYLHRKGRWIATIGKNGKKIHIGSFSSKEEAVEARLRFDVVEGYGPRTQSTIPMEHT